MEATSPSSSSLSANQRGVSSLDDLPIQQSLLLSESIMVLRNMRSQLYSAAEYFELSNMNDDGKEMVMRSLKDYAVKAIANAVDHLGSVSYKVDNLLDYEVDEASVATFEVSCIDQRLRTWQTHIDHEGLSQQSLLIKPPKYHKHYILQGKTPFLFIKFNCNAFITTSQPTADSGKLSMLKCQGFYPPKENSKLNQHQTDSPLPPLPCIVPVTSFPLLYLIKSIMEKNEGYLYLYLNNKNNRTYAKTKNVEGLICKKKNSIYFSEAPQRRTQKRFVSALALFQTLLGFLMPMLCLTSPAVGAVQFPLVLDGSAFGYLHLHLHQDAVPCHPREEDWVSWLLLEGSQNR
ncbi:unnamed protein product [Musa textilis]